MSSAFERFVERYEEAFLPRRRFSRSDHIAWLRVAILMWTSLGVTVVLAIAALATAVAGRGHVAWSASLAALAALILVTRHRAAPAPRAHGHMLFTLVILGAGLMDVACGGRGLGAVTVLPLVLLLAVVLMPGVDAGIWGAAAMFGMLLAAFLGVDDMGRISYLMPLAGGVGLAALVGTHIVLTCQALVRGADEAGIDAAAAHDHERHDRERFDAFVALPGDWYWETETDLALSFLSPGFAEHYGVVPDAVLGTSPDDALRASFPDQEGADELGRAMRQRLEFSAQIVSFTGPGGRRVTLRLNGWPAHAGNGLFLGYRGGAREVTGSPAVISARASLVS